jgi:hypothetical protein
MLFAEQKKSQERNEIDHANSSSDKGDFHFFFFICKQEVH